MSNIDFHSEFSPPAAADVASGLTQEKCAHRLRQRRQVIAVFCCSYIFDGLLLSSYAAAGTTSPWIGVSFASVGLVIMAVFLAISETGWSNRFREHYLVLPVVLSNTIFILAFLLAAPEVGVVFLGALFLLFTYSSIRLTAIDTLVAGSVLLAGLTVLMLYAKIEIAFPQATLAERGITVAVLTAFFLRATMVGVFNSKLRASFYDRGQQLQEAYRRIKNLAELDELTGTFNRRYIMAALEQEIGRFARGGAPCSVALIDLDWFKKINDEHGHPIGDEVLRTFAISVFANIRSIDKFSRYGGEEFLVVLPETTSEAAGQAIDRLRKIIADLDWSALAPHMKVTISAGIATLAADDDVESVLMRADRALYRAKREGRNRVCSSAISRPAGRQKVARLEVLERSGQKV